MVGSKVMVPSDRELVLIAVCRVVETKSSRVEAVPDVVVIRIGQKRENLRHLGIDSDFARIIGYDVKGLRRAAGQPCEYSRLCRGSENRAVANHFLLGAPALVVSKDEGPVL